MGMAQIGDVGSKFMSQDASTWCQRFHYIGLRLAVECAAAYLWGASTCNFSGTTGSLMRMEKHHHSFCYWSVAHYAFFPGTLSPISYSPISYSPISYSPISYSLFLDNHRTWSVCVTRRNEKLE